jgi:DeoR/GlpR family transcriptional regulator of sugar metabolism
MDAARKVIMVAEHTKFGKSAMVHLAQLDAADTMVTGCKLAPEYRQMIQTKGIQVLIARGASIASLSVSFQVSV